MKFEDALVALRNGKKVRSIGWPKETCIVVNEMGRIVSNEGTHIDSWSSASLLTDDWEIVKKPSKKEIWVSWYCYDDGNSDTPQALSKSSALLHNLSAEKKGMKVLARKKITLIEGEFDE